MANLTNTPLVMIWRRALNMARAKMTTQRVNGWPEVGEDGFSMMCDAGNVLFSYWNQAQLLTRGQGESASAAVPVVPACSGVTSTPRAEALNPSNQITLVVGDKEVTRQRLSSLAGRSIQSTQQESRAGTYMSVVDDVGNTTRYLHLAAGVGAGKLGERVKSLRDSGIASGDSPAVSYELLVKDLKVARSFYVDILGLRDESTVKSEAVFDTGNLLLSLQREPAVGLMKIVRQAGKLTDDLIVFHTSDLESTMSELSAKGVAFTRGIEASPSGRLAVFTDPDGHNLCMWQPPARDTALGINFFSVLDRLLASASTHFSAGA